MAELLLINPRKRRGRKSSAKRVRRSAKRARRVRRNPVSMAAVTRRARIHRLSNPRKRSRSRRRRNPIDVRGVFGSIVPMLQDAAVGAVGSIAVDAAMGQINRFLPATLQPTPGAVGVNDAIKVVATIALGQVLSRPTRGLSRRAAAGALTVQMDRIVRTFLPVGIRSQLAYGTVAPVVPGRATVQPNAQRMAAYTRPGTPTPLLSAYVPPGAPSPLLNGRNHGIRAGHHVMR